MSSLPHGTDTVDPSAPGTGTCSRAEEWSEPFEHAWRPRLLPKIDDFLRSAGAEQESLLVELIHVDLEFRLKAGESARVEAYFDRYPSLAQDSSALVDL